MLRASDRNSDMSSNKEKTKHVPDPGAPNQDSAPPAAEPAPTAPPTATPEPAPPSAPADTAAPEAPLTAEQIAAWQAKAAQADEHWDRLLRAKADLDNYKKRAARERQDAVRFANVALIEKLIPALDSFDMALVAANAGEGGGLASLKTGIAMVHGQIKTALAEAGLQEVDAAGQVFDPQMHEAVSQLESADVPEGHVLQQLRKGYKLHERLIRPATVVVAKKPAA
jgi:molecular chaperone GrpE